MLMYYSCRQTSILEDMAPVIFFVGFFVSILLILVSITKNQTASTITVKGKWWKTTTSICIYEKVDGQKGNMNGKYVLTPIKEVSKSGAWHDSVEWPTVDVSPEQTLIRSSEYSMVIVYSSGEEESRGISREEYDMLELGKMYSRSSRNEPWKEVKAENPQ